MPINFPNNPSSGQLYTYDNKTWEYNGIYWEVYSALTSYVGGSGTTNYIPKWTGTTNVGNSQIVDDGTRVSIGGVVLDSTFSVNGSLGVRGIQINNTGGSIGITDVDLTGWGSGGNEIAIGTSGPLSVSQGMDNIAIGGASQSQNDTGIRNVSVGSGTLISNQAGQQNTAIGHKAGFSVTSGSYNVLIGHGAGYNLETGGSNVFLGNDAGFNETGSNKLYIANSGGTPLIYGEFDNGIVNINGTLSATTYDNLPGSSSANCFTTFYVTNISGCSPVNVLSPLNVVDGLSVTGTSTFINQATFLGGLSASTFSASTFQNLPISAVTNGTGISASTIDGTVTIVNTDLGSAQNIFKNIRINGITQFSANSNTDNLNFSGINLTITSASTNTLVFSAGTGGSGGLTEDYYTIICNQGGFNPVDSTTYYIGQGGYAPSTTVNTRNVSIPFTSTLTNVTIVSGAANAATTQDTTVIFRLNNTTDYTLSNVVKFSGGNAQSNGATLTYNITGLNISVTAGNFFEIKMICPAWVTNPTSASLTMMLYFKR